jgi:hypothetical protein
LAGSRLNATRSQFRDFHISRFHLFRGGVFRFIRFFRVFRVFRIFRVFTFFRVFQDFRVFRRLPPLPSLPFPLSGGPSGPPRTAGSAHSIISDAEPKKAPNAILWKETHTPTAFFLIRNETESQYTRPRT